MSIQDEIRGKMGTELFGLAPFWNRDPIARRVIYCKELKELIEPPWNNQLGEARCRKARDDLEAFVRGSPISVARRPRKAKLAYMSRLDDGKHAIWDVRCRDPDPGLRILGGFSDRDEFIAVWWGYRKCLGKYGSDEWHAAIGEAQLRWRNLFYPYQPVITRGPLTNEVIRERYISEGGFLS